MAFLRNCIFGAIIFVAIAIVIGGMTDSVPGPIAEFFQYAFLLLFGSAAWGARALADVRPILFETLALLVLFYILTRPQPDGMRSLLTKKKLPMAEQSLPSERHNDCA